MFGTATPIRTACWGLAEFTNAFLRTEPALYPPRGVTRFGRRRLSKSDFALLTAKSPETDPDCFKKSWASVNYFTFGTDPLSASSRRHRGDANACMDNRRRGRDWPDLVRRRDVELGPRGGRLGFGRDIAALNSPRVSGAVTA